MSRSAVLGSIVVERSMDGLTVVSLLLTGLYLLASSTPAIHSEQYTLLGHIAVAGAVVFGVLVIGAWTAARSGRLTHRIRLPASVARRVTDFVRGLTTLRGLNLGRTGLLSLAIWACEGLALWCILMSLDTVATPMQILILIGTVSLSTLIPTAPAYLGTLQYAFYLALSISGVAGAVGIVAATVTQLFLFGAVTVAGLCIYLYRRILDMLLASRTALQEE